MRVKHVVVGINFLHSHPVTEQKLGLPSHHVIVDRDDWEEVVSLFRRQPGLVNEISTVIEEEQTRTE